MSARSRSCARSSTWGSGRASPVCSWGYEGRAMIAFGASITEPEQYERFAEPGIRLVAEPDSAILARGSAGSVFRSYNMLMDEASKLGDLEALVLLHQDAEITDPDFLKKIREAISDPDVAIVGCVGAIGVRNIAWWDGSVTWASFTHRYEELGGGEVPGLAWTPEETPTYAGTGEVETVDGFVLGLTPWAIRELRFDESLGQAIHGYDFDLCLQARSKGKKVVTADLKVVHHHDLKLIRDVGNWIEAHVKVAEKWDGRMPLVGKEGDPEDWKARARRAEAQASAERMIALSSRLYRDARIDLLLRQREQMEEEATRLRETKDRLAAELKDARAKRPRRGRLRRLVKEPRRTIGGYLRRRRSGRAPSGELE